MAYPSPLTCPRQGLMRYLLAASLACACSGFVLAQAPMDSAASSEPAAPQKTETNLLPVKVTTQIDHSTVAPSGTVVLTANVEYPPGEMVNLPDPSFLRFPSFKIKNSSSMKLPDSDGYHHTRYTAVLAPDGPGPHTIVPLEVDYITPDGTLETARSMPIKVQVGAATTAKR